MRALWIGMTLLATSTASADVSKAWTAAKDHVPAGAELVAGFDVAAIVASKAFTTAFPQMVAHEKDLQEGLDLVKNTCKLDPLAVVDGIVVAVNAQTDDDDGIVFVQLKGVDRATAESCGVALLKAIGEKQVSVKQEGAITALSASGDTAYGMWVTSDVVAIAIRPDKKAQLASWTGQKGAFAKSALAAQIAKLDPKSVAWGAFAFPKPLDEDLPVLRGHGNATIGGGKVAVTMRGTFDSAKTAAKTLAGVKKSLARELKSKSTPPAGAKLLKKFGFTIAGADVTFKATASEADTAAGAATIH